MCKIVTVVECGGSGVRLLNVAGENYLKLGGPPIRPSRPIESADKLMEFVRTNLHPQSFAVAYSVAGIVEKHKTVILAPHMHFLDGVNLFDLTNQMIHLPAYVGNDMETSVTGMHAIFPELDFFIGITWSSGIGTRIYQKGVGIIADSESSHMRIDQSPWAMRCGCGRQGCVDVVCGGRSIGRRIRDELEARAIPLPPEKSLWAFLDEEYLLNKSWACDVYRQITQGMGLYLANIQTTIRLPAIVFKGTFAKKALVLPGIAAAIREAMRANLAVPDWANDLEFFRVPGPPDMMEDGDAFLGGAELARQYFGETKAK